MVLALLLTPKDLGLVAMVTTVMGYLIVFKDAGLSTATVQREGITHTQVSNLFWINVALSGAVSLVLAASSNNGCLLPPWPEELVQLVACAPVGLPNLNKAVRVLPESMISVVIPSYNRSSLLKRAIDSALAQTIRATEVIVVDDGSTDNTRESCAGYGNQIKYVSQKNSGASVARNTGAMLARGSWIAFLDSDDYWTPCHLARMVKAIEKTHGEARFYFSDMQMGEGDNCTTLWQAINFAPPHPVHLMKDGTNWAFLRRQPIMLQCSVFRKDVWVESGGLDPNFRLMHDPELFFRLGVGAKICAVSGIGCVLTDDDVSNVRLTTAVQPYKPEYWKEQIALWRSVLRRFPSLPSRYERIARRRLAASHWRLFRVYSSSKNVAERAWQLPMVVWADPRFALSLLVHMRADANRPLVLPEY